MRGRTNVTQRTGPYVIGQEVTQKQVTGSAISMGDFVEFTGDTTQIQTLLNLDYDLVANCRINSSTFVFVFFKNPIFRFVVIKDNVIVKDKTLSGVDTITWTGSNTKLYIGYYNNQLYVSFGIVYNGNNYNTLLDKCIYIFNYNSETYDITYDSGLDLSSIHTDLTGANYTKFVFLQPKILNGYFYVYVCGDSNTNSDKITALYKLNLNGTYNSKNIVASGSSMVFLYDTLSFGFVKNIDETWNTNYVWVVYGQNARTCLLLSTSDITVSIDSLDISVTVQSTLITAPIEYLYIYNNILIGCLDRVMKIWEIGNSSITFLKQYIYRNYTSSNGGSVSDFGMIINVELENSNPIFEIIGVYTVSSTSREERYFRVIYDYSGAEFTDFTEVIISKSNSENFVCPIVWINTTNRYYNYCYDDRLKTFKKIPFSVVSDGISLVASYDLVKKYSSRIDGVAKGSGNVGELIRVYIPN